MHLFKSLIISVKIIKKKKKRMFSSLEILYIIQEIF